MLPTLPAVWADEWNALALRQRAQWGKGYVFGEGEEHIGDEHFAQLEAKRATPEELAELAPSARGEYRVGDTRGFIGTQEQQCLHWNCWMVRDESGAPRYVSEPQPGLHADAEPVSPNS